MAVLCEEKPPCRVPKKEGVQEPWKRSKRATFGSEITYWLTARDVGRPKRERARELQSKESASAAIHRGTTPHKTRKRGPLPPKKTGGGEVLDG